MMIGDVCFIKTAVTAVFQCINVLVTADWADTVKKMSRMKLSEVIDNGR